MPHLDGTLLHTVHHTEGRHQLTARMGRDLELAAGHLTDLLGRDVGGAKNRVQRLRKAGRQTPADLCLCVHDGRCAAGRENASQTGTANK